LPSNIDMGNYDRMWYFTVILIVPQVYYEHD
jgi:hypothetical protein